jgi:hypothetical protein
VQWRICPLSSVIRFRKAPLNGRRLVPKTRVTARSEVRFLSLPPIAGIRDQVSGIRLSGIRFLIPNPCFLIPVTPGKLIW